MGTNLTNFDFNKLYLTLSNYQNWDFYLYPWDNDGELSCATNLDDCTYINIDFNNPQTYYGEIGSDNPIISLNNWSKAVNDGLSLVNIGLTGLDNGLFKYDKLIGDTYNEVLENMLTGSEYEISSGVTNMIFNPVSGSTGKYQYPIETVSGETGPISKLCGGFYQGFYKVDGKEYSILPDRYENGWGIEFKLKKEDCDYSGNTLNKDFPNNKGIFFYMGTRAENKFWNQYEGDSGVTFPTNLKENDILLENNDGNVIPLSPPNIVWNKITNKFLIYHRGKNGVISSKNGGVDEITVSGYTEEVTDNRNKFLTFHRGRGGYGGWCNNQTFSGETGILASNYSGDTAPITELDYKKDLENNAIAFRITDDGRIGYRSMVGKNCEEGLTGLTIKESYSPEPVIEDGEWFQVVVRFKYYYEYTECDLKNKPLRKGRLMFYVNGKLKHIEENVDEILPKRLNDDSIKQEGVPYNISIGGGTQGLVDSMTFNGQDINDINLELVNNFGGSFEGYISNFKFFGCDIKYDNVTDLFEDNQLI